MDQRALSRIRRVISLSERVIRHLALDSAIKQLRASRSPIFDSTVDFRMRVKCRRAVKARRFHQTNSVPPHATRGVLLRELRWKNSAWLATAETIAGWNGFEIRNAGSGRSPVRKRSG